MAKTKVEQNFDPPLETLGQMHDAFNKLLSEHDEAIWDARLSVTPLGKIKKVTLTHD